MVEELSGVTHARRIKVRRGEDKIQTDTVVLTFDSPKPSKQRIYTEPALHLDGQTIPVKGEAKFLGVIFDQKLCFENHVKYLKNKCSKALNLLRVVGHTNWGADRATLLKLYRTLVRSKLDYGSVIHGSAKKHVLRALDPIHHQGLRIALRAFRTSPIKSLYTEAGEPSLEHRRMKLAMF
ncbi:RNA-directed DNA polymerase from mobile element jockey [Plakobranchus ocellatus]|uniref:RNA-directed DNA polymerase from mobile element jockey n=1 Tax=Plakobranchus ocellatus TaxID=259542 RepID=A0AAV4B782_9GAST|nr:RNA-directed DNA polymerase from mobile element jockey [Plakobranchus ocellatus]